MHEADLNSIPNADFATSPTDKGRRCCPICVSRTRSPLAGLPGRLWGADRRLPLATRGLLCLCIWRNGRARSARSIWTGRRARIIDMIGLPCLATLGTYMGTTAFLRFRLMWKESRL